jgi:hypothetical protein
MVANTRNFLISCSAEVHYHVHKNLRYPLYIFKVVLSFEEFPLLGCDAVWLLIASHPKDSILHSLNHCATACPSSLVHIKNKQASWLLVRKRTVPTERQPLLSEI